MKKDEDITIDGLSTYLSPYRSKCAKCTHFDKSSACYCKAFPYGIPIDFLTGDKHHEKKEKSQKGDFIFTLQT
ncbi:MAG: hypothetical protein ACRCZB_00095 [Bacteroidales bacterium]